MSAEERPVAPFVLGLIGVIFILLGAFAMSMFAFRTGSMMNMMGMMGGTTASFDGLMATMMDYSFAFVVVGLTSGALVLLGSVMLYIRPSESPIWSAVVLAFSLVSVVGAMGGFMVGLVMGVLGGIFGLVWRPSTSNQMRGFIDRPNAGNQTSPAISGE